jgi:hypothetical protein
MPPVLPGAQFCYQDRENSLYGRSIGSLENEWFKIIYTGHFTTLIKIQTDGPVTGRGKIERREQLENKLGKTSLSTIEVLTEELAEIMRIEFSHPAARYKTPCYLTMSVHDPLLDFQTTLTELENHFTNVYVTKLYFPYHQPPNPFTFDELNRDFKESAEKFML